MRAPWSNAIARRLPWILAIASVPGAGAWFALHPRSHAAPQGAPSMTESPSKAGPPWIYGRRDARFTVIEYADLECPYCRAYFPVLRGWIDVHPDVDWQWRHLPLPMHQPAALDEARLAECAGEVGGVAAFWNAVAWIYGHTRGDGQGLPSDARLPFSGAAIQRCLSSARPDGFIREQAAEAARAGIAATPTLRLLDRRTGRMLLLPGPVDGDALLSAIDLLSERDIRHTAGGLSSPSPATLPNDTSR
ncbi:DsbA family protein [Gluconacetobacter sp. Hr-1-5]|uniref:DsbA family protein n=1 Tax=Gluconacetobacter sp. Hr-1-5 TaxID=3395370 RepID=UPI003B526734